MIRLAYLILRGVDRRLEFRQTEIQLVIRAFAVESLGLLRRSYARSTALFTQLVQTSIIFALCAAFFALSSCQLMGMPYNGAD